MTSDINASLDRIRELLEWKKAVPVGTERTWKKGTFVKTDKGWVRVKTGAGKRAGSGSTAAAASASPEKTGSGAFSQQEMEKVDARETAFHKAVEYPKEPGGDFKVVPDKLPKALKKQYEHMVKLNKMLGDPPPRWNPEYLKARIASWDVRDYTPKDARNTESFTSVNDKGEEGPGLLSTAGQKGKFRISTIQKAKGHYETAVFGPDGRMYAVKRTPKSASSDVKAAHDWGMSLVKTAAKNGVLDKPIKSGGTIVAKEDPFI